MIMNNFHIIFYINIYKLDMPLPAHLAQKLAQRGIIKRNFNNNFLKL